MCFWGLPKVKSTWNAGTDAIDKYRQEKEKNQPHNPPPLPEILYNESIKILLSFLLDALNLPSLKVSSKPLNS